MRRLLIVLAIFFGASSLLSAQSAADSVRQVVNQFFIAMRATDTAQLRNLMTPSVIFQTVKSASDGTSVPVHESVNEFLKTIASLKPGQADEQIEIASVNMEGALASVWAPYQFYFNNKFSHCGVNSFTLIRSGGHWRIHLIIDTRQKINCSSSGSK